MKLGFPDHIWTKNYIAKELEFEELSKKLIE